MKLLFIRHGDPNYEKDCLTELGKKEAALLAERMAHTEVTEFFVSKAISVLKFIGRLSNIFY